MPTASQTQSSKSTRRSAAAKKAAATRAKDAIALLKADHRAVEKLFKEFEKASGGERQMQLARKICLELKVHTQLEEELVYPVSREFLDDDDIVNEAIVEHQAAKDLIAEIEGMDASDEMFEAKVTVLQEQIEHHVEEEETEYFPKIQKTEMDTKAIGQQMIARKKELMAQMQGDGMEMH
jgi:hemerythrin superfamily protein